MVLLENFHIQLPGFFRNPQSQTDESQETDFLLINPKYNYFALLEVKYKLSVWSFQKALTQISKTKRILERYFCNDISRQWKFIGLVGYVEKHSKFQCSQRCEPFLVQTTNLKDFFKKIETDLEEVNKDDNEDYKTIVRYNINISYPYPYIFSRESDSRVSNVRSFV